MIYILCRLDLLGVYYKSEGCFKFLPVHDYALQVHFSCFAKKNTSFGVLLSLCYSL